MKRKFLLFVFLMQSAVLFCQEEKFFDKLSGSAGIFGVGFDKSLVNKRSQLPVGYNFLVEQKKGYFVYELHVSLFWKEKWGLRLGMAFRDNLSSSDAFKSYLQNTFADYEINLTNISPGYHTQTFSPALTYLFHKNFFYCSPFVGFGYGGFSAAEFNQVFKRVGSNDFKEVHCQTFTKREWNSNAGADFYFRFSSNSVRPKLTVGLTISHFFAPVKYSVTYTEQDYAQPQQLQSFAVKDKIQNVGAYVFVGLLF